MEETGQKNNTRGVRYSKSERYDFSKSFKEQIKDYKNGVFPKGDTLIVRDTPKVFQKLGLNALPMTYTQIHLKEALDNKDGDHLGERIKLLPEALESPIAIIDSKSNPGRLVAIIEIPNGVKKSIAAIEIDGKGHMHGKHIDSNAIVSAYDKESIIYNHLSAAVVNELLGNGGIYYWQKEKAIQLVSARGVQFPKGDIKDGFVKRISDSKSKVKKKYHDVKNTRQFRYWFGDWQNKPQNASKVVDKDGKPLVVYHQTDADFTVFDTESKGAGRYDDETPAGIFLKPTNADIGLQGQKQMALYANIRNPLSVNSRDDLVRYYSKKY